MNNIENGILEKSPNQFTVVFNNRHYGYFTSKAGAEAFLECLLDNDEQCIGDKDAKPI